MIIIMKYEVISAQEKELHWENAVQKKILDLLHYENHEEICR